MKYSNILSSDETNNSKKYQKIIKKHEIPINEFIEERPPKHQNNIPKPEKQEKQQKQEKIEKTWKNENNKNNEKFEKKNDKKEKFDKQEKNAKIDKLEKTEKNVKPQENLEKTQKPKKNLKNAKNPIQYELIIEDSSNYKERTVQKPIPETPFFSPRERNPSPKDLQTILQVESQRYWSPNHAKLKSNDYFLAKRQEKIKIEQKMKENEANDGENQKAKEENDEYHEEQRKKEQDEEKPRKITLNNQVFVDKNLKFKPVLKEKEEVIVKSVKNIEKPNKNKENPIKNHDEVKNINFEGNYERMKQSNEYFLNKLESQRKKDFPKNKLNQINSNSSLKSI